MCSTLFYRQDKITTKNALKRDLKSLKKTSDVEHYSRMKCE